MAERGTEWDRFAGWSPVPSRIALGFILLLLVLASLLALPENKAPAASHPVQTVEPVAGTSSAVREDDEDLVLYRRIIERVAAGEPYHKVATEEQRAANFPVRPGLAVRLPTLAMASAFLGSTGLLAAAALLAGSLMLAWWRRLGSEPGGADHRLLAMALLALGTVGGFKPYYFPLHEVWTGVLLALSFGLHRGGRWKASLVAAGLALAIREHALPFVLLMGAFALWNRRWVEFTAWAALVAAFGVALVIHLGIVANYVMPDDPISPPWLVMRGLNGFTLSVRNTGFLQFLPPVIAAPLALLPLLGWAGWKSPAGLFGTLLFAGYAVFFMLAGRENNFYWVLVITPAYFMGLVFLPMAVGSLWRSAKA